MRWLSFFILAYILLGLQLGVGGQVQYHGTAPNLALLGVIFISLNAPHDEALLASFLLGAMQDLVTLQPMGLFAFSYGLVALLVVTLSQLAERKHPLTHFSFALIGGAITGVVLLVHGWIHPVAPAITDGITVSPAVRLSARSIFISILYTALLSPILLGILQRMQGLFAFEAPRRKTRM